MTRPSSINSLKIEWDRLEEAFDVRLPDAPGYLDLRSGRVLFQGEGSEGTESTVPGHHCLYVPDADLREDLRQMTAFAATVRKPPVRAALRSALQGRGPAGAFRTVLRECPLEQARWESFRRRKLHEEIDAWLKGNRVRAETEPPWRTRTGPDGAEDTEPTEPVVVVYDQNGLIDMKELTELFNAVGWQRRTKKAPSLAAMVRQSTFYVTATEGDRLVGFARAISDGVFNAYISTVVVRETHRGRGIGRALIEHLMNGRDSIKFVLHSNEPARGFYERLGFVPATDMFVREPAK